MKPAEEKSHGPLAADKASALLRRFEPVLAFTRGELFFPMDVETYLQACSLWAQQPDREPVLLVPPGELTLDHLARVSNEHPATINYLKIAESLSPAKLAAYKLRRGFDVEDHRERFQFGVGRLARVGYISRFTDAFFSMSLLARGRVPGDTAAAAAMAYRRIRRDRERYCYYGRALRQDGWVVLQYWFFYLFNNWRSGYAGANDHESDWEMICLYLSETRDGDFQPEWAAYASHDYSGDDLRRRWDDPEIRKEGEHPVVFCGAGSHAGYFSPGEYLTELELPVLSPVSRIFDALRDVWHKKLHQYRVREDPSDHLRRARIFHIPFVDYARGDGLVIGPGSGRPWQPPGLLEPPPAWVTGYRGLWGLYAQDPLSGENAPAGPMYNRDGTVRRAWYDPVGWAGLDKAFPISQALRKTDLRQAEVRARQETTLARLNERSTRLRNLGIEAEAMRKKPHVSKLLQGHRTEIGRLSEEVRALRAQLAADSIVLDALKDHAADLARGQRGPLRTHLQRPQQPTSAVQLRVIRLAEVWAAVSVGIMLIGLVGLTLFARAYFFFGLAAIIALFVVIEAGLRGRLIQLITVVNIGLTIGAALIFFYEFYWHILILAVIAAGFYLLWDNLREIIKY